MKRPNKWLVVLLLLFVGYGVYQYIARHPSEDKIAETVKTMLQQKLDDQPEFKEYHLTVEKVAVIHEAGNKYRGLATVAMNGDTHEVLLTILSEDGKIMFEAAPGSFMFIARDAIQKELNLTPR